MFNCRKILYIVLILIVAFPITSCRKKDKKAPEDIIVKEKMISILTDVNLVEGSVRMKQPTTKNDSLQIKAYYDEIFKKYKITKQQFENSMKYYTKNPEKLGEIYDEVINKLSRMQTEENVKK